MGIEDRIDGILLAWRESLDRGEFVDPEEIIRRHPDLERPLRARFQALAVFDAVFAGAPAAPEGLRPMPSDRYEGFELCGEGGMGIVFRTRDRDLHREIAIKTIRPEGSGPTPDTVASGPTEAAPPPPGTVEARTYESLRARFLQEAWITAGLEHPGVIPVYELGENEKGVPYYTMRYVKGLRTLERAIEETHDLQGRIELLEPFLKVCDTIRYAHSRGLIHRDLKPDHIALGEFGEVIVLDWGLAKVRGRPDFGRDLLQERIEEYRDLANLKTSAAALGTPGYMAPEAARGDMEAVDERSDIFSLGAILYRILTRRLPYPPEHFTGSDDPRPDERPDLASEVEPGVPEDLARICSRALAVDPGARYADVDAFARALRSWRRDSTIESEATALLREARAQLAGAGPHLLARLDRASALLARVLHIKPDDDRARELAGRIEEERSRTHDERERALRRRLVVRFALPLLVVVVIAGAAAWVLDARRREAVRQEARVSAALRDARALALAQASEMVEADDPMLSLLLAREAARSAPLFPVVSRLHAAVSRSREREVLRGHGDPVFSAAFSPTGDRIVTASDDETARIWDDRGRTVAVLLDHTDRVRTAAFSPDGKKIVTASDDMTARVWTSEGSPLAVLSGHEDYVVAAVFSPSGHRILTVSWDRTARLWTDDGELLAIFREPAGVPDAAFFPDGRRVVTCSRDGSAHVWSDDGSLLATLSGHADSVTAVAVSPSGKSIVTASLDGTAAIWEASGTRVAVLSGHEAGVQTAAFSPAGDRILTGARDGEVRLWTADGKLLAVMVGHDRRVNRVAFSPDGRRIASASDDGTARIWSRDGGCLATLAAHGAEVYTVAFSPLGRRLVTASADGTARIWSVEVSEIGALKGHRDEVGTVVFSASGDRILTASEDGTARVWDRDGNPLFVMEGEGGALTAARFSPDGLTILTASWDGTARLWDEKGELLADLKGHRAGIWTALFSPDGRFFLTASEDRTALLWDRRGRLRAVLQNEGPVLAAAFSPDSRRIVTTSGDRTARLWDIEGKPLGVLEGHEGLVSSVAFSPSGDRIATASWDRTARIWTSNGKPISVLTGHGAEVEDVVFSPSGDAVLTACGDGAARLFRPDGTLLAVLGGHPKGIALARFSPDGRSILTAAGRMFPSKDSTARLWTREGKEIAILDAPGGRVSAAVFSPGGDRILTASEDGTVRIWLTDLADLLRLADRRVTRPLTEAERRRYLTVIDPNVPLRVRPESER